MIVNKELLEEVEKINEITISDAEKWVELFQKIPISSILQTSLSGLQKRGDFFDYDDDNSAAEGMIFWLVIKLKEEKNEEDDVDLTSCNFYSYDRAEIESYEESQGSIFSDDDYQRLIDVNFFGFSGTWEEVVRKIVEANNILHPIVPPFVF
jgi:hypothetical protein